MEVVNERSTSTIVITFKGDDGALIVPDTCNYTLHDIKSEVVIKTDTLVPTSSTVSLVFSPDNNRIIDATQAFEVRSLTVTITYSSGTKQGTAQYYYSVKNLHYIVNP